MTACLTLDLRESLSRSDVAAIALALSVKHNWGVVVTSKAVSIPTGKRIPYDRPIYRSLGQNSRIATGEVVRAYVPELVDGFRLEFWLSGEEPGALRAGAGIACVSCPVGPRSAPGGILAASGAGSGLGGALPARQSASAGEVGPPVGEPKPKRRYRPSQWAIGRP